MTGGHRIWMVVKAVSWGALMSSGLGLCLAEPGSVPALFLCCSYGSAFAVAVLLDL